jgi:hypothetical protein
MARSYLDYAMSVIVGRALPDVRDGLKPVHRRVLYAMFDAGYRPDKGYYKSSRVVGDVMGNYHPHGDSAIYDTLVRLAQPWSLRYPLVDGNGNFGSPGNDPAAAMRYTEARLAPLAISQITTMAVRKSQWYYQVDSPTYLLMAALELLLEWRRIFRHITSTKWLKASNGHYTILMQNPKNFSKNFSPLLKVPISQQRA